MPVAPKYGVIHEQQLACNEAIDSFVRIQELIDGYFDLPSPMKLAHQLRTHAITEFMLDGVPMKVERFRMVARCWWDYLQKEFDLPETSYAYLELNKRCIAPLIKQGFMVCEVEKDGPKSTEGRKELANWLLQTYYPDKVSKTAKVSSPSVSALMKDFAGSLERELVEVEEEASVSTWGGPNVKEMPAARVAQILAKHGRK